MAKVKLLNDGGYGGAKSVSFPVVVEGIERRSRTVTLAGFCIKGYELHRVGFTGLFDDRPYFFFSRFECELIKEVE